MDNPASPADLTAFGYSGEADPKVQQRWLDASWRALVREVPSVPASVEAGELAKEAVADVVSAAALRVLRNPEGIVKDSGGVDNYTESREVADASQDIYFTAAEQRRLQPDAGGSPGAFTIRPR